MNKYGQYTSSYSLRAKRSYTPEPGNIEGPVFKKRKQNLEEEFIRIDENKDINITLLAPKSKTPLSTLKVSPVKKEKKEKIVNTAVQKRKQTLREKSLNSVNLIPLSQKDGILEVKYKHTSNGTIRVEKAYPFGKGMKEKLNQWIANKSTPFDQHLGLYYTGNPPVSPTKGTRLPIKLFEVRKGHDIVIDNVVIEMVEAEGCTVRPARVNSTYNELAQKLDKIVIDYKARNSNSEDETVRRRVSKDIQRIGGGLPSKGHYTRLEWHYLSEFAAVIKTDKGRSLRATREIDQNLNDNNHSFLERFGGNDPIYKGTGEGTVWIGENKVKRGAAALRALAEGKNEYDEETDYGSDMEMEDLGIVREDIKIN